MVAKYLGVMMLGVAMCWLSCLRLMAEFLFLCVGVVVVFVFSLELISTVFRLLDWFRV